MSKKNRYRDLGDIAHDLQHRDKWSVFGTAGDDTLTGTAGRDRIYGLDGNDVIDGRAGDDKLYGGTGNDTFVFSGLFGRDEIEDAGSGDALVFSNLTISDLVFLDHGDSLIIRAADGSGEVKIEHYFTTMPDLTVNGESLATLLASVTGSDIVGTEGNDYLVGTLGADTIDARGGDDRVEAGAGDDTVWGGAGNDRISGGAGDDWLAGGDGWDSIDGDAGDDTLVGGAGDDRLEGGQGIDTAVFAGEAADFQVWGRGGRLVVTDTDPTDGSEGRDYLKSVEVLQFGDLVIDLSAVHPAMLDSIFAGGPVSADVLATMV
ncbi:Hemolysin, chromosomal [bacterium HR39]|nr:Hemolysin, chromosomal [bacterium HR39]